MAASKGIVRKSDVGAPPLRMSAGAPPSLSASSLSKKNSRMSASRSSNARSSNTSARKRKAEENFEVEDSDSEQSTAAEDQDENDSGGEGPKKDESAEEKVKKARKKRRFRLTDSTAKSKRRAERKAQLAAERKEREENKQEMDDEEDEKVTISTPPPVTKPPMIRTYSPMQLLCDNLLRKLHAKDPEEYFAFPVTPSMAPDYHLLISKPMDFSTMRVKIENNEYPNVAAFRADAQLVVNNALAYNQPNTIYHVAAQKLEQIVTFYFSEQYLRFLFHTLPFCKDIPLTDMGLTPKVRLRELPKVNRKVEIVDDVTPSAILSTVDVSLKSRLSSRVANLQKIMPNCENGKEPRCHLSYLENKDGAVCLNVIGSTGGDRKTVTLGDFVGKLEEGTPGLCAPQEPKTVAQVPISFLSYGPFSSFAPQYDSTWATLCDRDSRLLLSTYGDKSNATNAVSLRQMVDKADHLSGLVDDLLDTLTDGEHRRTFAALQNEAPPKVPDLSSNKILEEVLNDLESLENIGIDVSFVADFRKLYATPPPQPTFQDELNKTGSMITDLALLQKNRLSSIPPATLSDQPLPSDLEVSLAGKIQDQLHTHVSQYLKPGDVVSPAVIHSAVGLNKEDLDLLKEFFTPAAV